ncbi:TPA: glycosyltransferase family 2 protein [Candidatus Poribacteria bacterium]|jgi:glycosyltransferase involved in cell wall biosynthesis|nr:glycosyltransferase family 2 protein [Candidatus Poribacteria bacterium]HIA70653.1 glycosyltransferase family 2 protein [Candidatus Poribacteria bacterium]HIB88672.1 glycosyltransferase family 2 protein [Candidatus Poribacteria bacterium]HIB98341.1 glycosyltransferase family 2 protein [Candidatus Poribacteria bacterium]HIN31414.1 glycosyltransferase family 2 protein [Candidatus Poribacteria bacterium]
MHVCLLLPAYNEAKTIGQVVREASEFVNDILVIDDGSVDKTAQIAEEAGGKVIKHSTNLGKGMALRTGFDYVSQKGYDLIATMDSDGQHQPSDLPRFIDYFKNNKPDIIIGARIHDRIKMPRHRRFNNWLVSSVGSALCGQEVKDFQSGFRLIRTEVLRSVELHTERYETESELLIKAGRIGFKIQSIPINTIYNAEVSNIKPLREMRLFTKLLINSLK